MSRFKRVLATAGIAAAGVLALAPVAGASGTGNTVNGCTAQWFDTAFSSNCVNTSQSGDYQTWGNCTLQADRHAPAQYVGAGSTVNGVSSDECTFSVTDARTSYLG